MGLGGGGNMSGQLQQTQQMMSQQQAGLASQQAGLSSQFAMGDLGTIAGIASLFAAANGQTPAGQNAAKLKVMDFIHTSPLGLVNNTFFSPARGTTNPKTGVTAAPTPKQKQAATQPVTATPVYGQMGLLG